MKCPCCGTVTDKVKEFSFAGDCVFWAGEPVEMYPRAARILEILWKKRDDKKVKYVPGSSLTPETIKPNSTSVYIYKLREILRDLEIPYGIESGPMGSSSFRLKRLNGKD
jgi:hypothetical protein